MSYGLIVGALFLAVLVLGTVGSLFWWVRRPISGRRESRAALPLFGHDRAAVYPRAEVLDDGEGDRAQLIMAQSPKRAATPDAPHEED